MMSHTVSCPSTAMVKETTPNSTAAVIGIQIFAVV
ncbi:hypothetical protein OROGR_008146 [Orobanche gracilis]